MLETRPGAAWAGATAGVRRTVPWRLRGWDAARLVLAVAALGMASSAFFQPPTLFMWQLSIGATEYGHWFGLLPLGLAAVGSWARRWSRVGTVVALVAAGLFFSTLVRAWPVANRLPGEMERAFGPTELTRPVLAWRELVGLTRFGIQAPEWLPYGMTAAGPLHLAFYRAAAGTHPAPCVVMLHTGGWEAGEVAEFPKMSTYLAGRGYAVASVEYRLAPGWRWPAPQEDTLAAIAYLQSHAPELGIDPQKLVLLGRSAGGQIAQVVAYTAHDPTIRGCIAFYAPSDLDFGYRFAAEDDLLHSRRLLERYLGGTPDSAPAAYRDASALNFVTSQAPPTLLLHGPPDPLVWWRHSARLEAALAQAGVRHQVVMLPWATHAFDWPFTGPGGQIARYAVERFLESVTR